MSKTLSEQLTELADWLEERANNAGLVSWRVPESRALHTKAAEVRTMAEQVRGTANHKVHTHQFGNGMGAWLAWISPTPSGKGNTEEEAIANLQSLLDQQKG